MKAILYFVVLFVFLMIFWKNISCKEMVWYSHLPDEKLTGAPKNLIKHEKEYQKIKNLIWSFIRKTEDIEKIIEAARRQQKVIDLVEESVPFLCPLNNIRSVEKPSNVHFIKPGDINVIGALGDSLTAGNGNFALNRLHVYIENRGISATIGGQGNWRKFRTLPNLLKEFNPKLIGYSLNDSNTAHPSSGFNLAEPGAMSQDMPFMAKQLIKRIKNDSRADFKNDWKLITVFIGANNFCADNCYLEDSSTSIQMHKDNMIKTFQILRDNMPRTIVNFIQTINVKALVEARFPSSCQMSHIFSCPCLFALQHKPRQKEFFKTLQGWQRVDQEIASDDQFKMKDDFVIILQHLLVNITAPIRHTSSNAKTVDTSLFSRDCFHFTQKANHIFATELWNSLLKPENEKTFDGFKETDTLICPTKDAPFIYTWKNSPPKLF